MTQEIFIDTHIITLYKFLEDPKSFLPQGATTGTFVICMPILRELETIKDYHISKGQRTRARNLLNKFLDQDIDRNEIRLTDEISLKVDLGESSIDEINLFKAITPDDQFVAKVVGSLRYGNKTSYILSNDGGVLLRAKYGAARVLPPSKLIPYSPSESLRYEKEEDGFSQNLKNLIKQISLEIATELRVHMHMEKE